MIRDREPRPIDDPVPRGKRRNSDGERAACVLLDPLTEVVVGMLVPVRVCSSQFVMNVLRYRKRGEREYQKYQGNRDAASQTLYEAGRCHYGRSQYHNSKKPVKPAIRRVVVSDYSSIP